MPRGDRTGPRGQGPMTGRGMGYCNNYNNPGFASPGFGRSCGRRMQFSPIYSKAKQATQNVQEETAQPKDEDQLGFLETQKEQIEQELAEIKRQIDNLKQRNTE